MTISRLTPTVSTAFASKHASDRDLLCLFQIISWSGLITYTLVSGFGANRLAVGWFVLLLVWFTFGNSGPMTQGIYSKLIGRGNAGLYFSVLQSNGAISRVVSGQLVGLAYGGLGAAWVWCSVHLLWCLQWAAFLSLWSNITPEAIAAMHARLAEEEEQAPPRGTRWVQRVEVQRMLEKLGARFASFLRIFPNACWFMRLRRAADQRRGAGRGHGAPGGAAAAAAAARARAGVRGRGGAPAALGPPRGCAAGGRWPATLRRILGSGFGGRDGGGSADRGGRRKGEPEGAPARRGARGQRVKGRRRNTMSLLPP